MRLNNEIWIRFAGVLVSLKFFRNPESDSKNLPSTNVFVAKVNSPIFHFDAQSVHSISFPFLASAPPRKANITNRIVEIIFSSYQIVSLRNRFLPYLSPNLFFRNRQEFLNLKFEKVFRRRRGYLTPSATAPFSASSVLYLISIEKAKTGVTFYANENGKLL